MNQHLTQTLDAAVDADARDAFNRIVRGVREATDPEPDLRRTGDALVLLCADAFNPRRNDAARERRWRRLVRALAPVAQKTHSTALLDVVRENSDLLEELDYRSTS